MRVLQLLFSKYILQIAAAPYDEPLLNIIDFSSRIETILKSSYIPLIFQLSAE